MSCRGIWESGSKSPTISQVMNFINVGGANILIIIIFYNIPYFLSAKQYCVCVCEFLCQKCVGAYEFN